MAPDLRLDKQFPNMVLSNKSFDDGESSMNIEDVYNMIRMSGVKPRDQ